MKYLVLASIFFSFAAHASYELADNGKAVTCKDEDELTAVLSKDRKFITLTIRDVKFGKLPVKKIVRGDDFVAYQTAKGDLTLTDLADTFVDKWQAYFPDCE